MIPSEVLSHPESSSNSSRSCSKRASNSSRSRCRRARAFVLSWISSLVCSAHLSSSSDRTHALRLTALDLLSMCLTILCAIWESQPCTANSARPMPNLLDKMKQKERGHLAQISLSFRADICNLTDPDNYPLEVQI